MQYKLSFPYKDTTSDWRLEREFWCKKKFGNERFYTYRENSKLIFVFWYKSDYLMFILNWGEKL